MTREAQLKAFAALVEQQTKDNQMQQYGKLVGNWEVKVKPGKLYTKVDIGGSGRYMVDGAGIIYGVKAYGVIHRGHMYGTLDTINEWYWGDYYARKIDQGIPAFVKVQAA